MVFRHPSEKSWSESQLGWWHSKLNGKSESKCSKPPTINRFETSIFPIFFRVGNHSINFTNTPMPGVFLMKLATPRCSKYQISISMKYIYIHEVIDPWCWFTSTYMYLYVIISPHKPNSEITLVTKALVMTSHSSLNWDFKSSSNAKNLDIYFRNLSDMYIYRICI